MDLKISKKKDRIYVILLIHITVYVYKNIKEKNASPGRVWTSPFARFSPSSHRKPTNRKRIPEKRECLLKRQEKGLIWSGVDVCWRMRLGGGGGGGGLGYHLLPVNYSSYTIWGPEAGPRENRWQRGDGIGTLEYSPWSSKEQSTE